jgi:hypothetical protein
MATGLSKIAVFPFEHERIRTVVHTDVCERYCLLKSPLANISQGIRKDYVPPFMTGFACLPCMIRVPGSTSWVSHTFPPMMDPLPMRTLPRIVVPA